MTDKRRIILERAKLLAEFPGQRLPLADRALRGRARAIASGTLLFYDRIPVRVGLRGIDWSGGHVRHQEWPAQLNRFGYLATLAAAWKATRDERFARAARAYVEDWIAGARYVPGAPLRPHDSTLNMSIRLGSSMHGGWGAVLPAFLDSAAFDDAFLDEVLASIAQQAEWLAAHLRPRGNWRVSELDAVVFTALRFPFLPGAKRRLDAGIRGLRAALATQFLPDGVHVERCPGYHRWMMTVAWNYRRLAKRFPTADARVDAEVIAKALDYDVQSRAAGINDSHTVFDAPDLSRDLARRRKMLRALGRPAADPPRQQVFRDAHQVFARSSWKPDADTLAFDASTWGGGHTHLSRNAFAFRSKGRLLVADPGIISYEVSDPYGLYGKSTSAHSTLNIGGLNQAQADGALLAAEFTRDVALLHAKYEGGYWPGKYGWGFHEGHGRGVFGEHKRVLFWKRGEYLLVLDAMESDVGSDVRNVFQMGPMDGWRMDAKRLAWRSTNRRGANVELRLALAPEGATMKCYEGSDRPIRGWIDGSVGRKGSTPAPLVEFRYVGRPQPGVVSAALIVPFTGNRTPGVRVLSAESHLEGYVHSLELQLPGGRRDFIAWTWRLELPIELPGRAVTDAPFVWLRRDRRGGVVNSLALRGSFLETRE